MGRYGFGLIAVLAVLIVPWTALAQGAPLFTGMNSFDLGSIQVSPWVKAGYQQMGVNVNVPVSVIPNIFPMRGTDPLDFKLLDAGIWIGGVGIEARRNGLSLFLAAEANATKSARAVMPSEWLFGGSLPVEWRGSNLEWWTIDGGGSVALNSDLAVMAGFKAEHLSMKLADPADPLGILQNLQALGWISLAGDIRTKLWVPYVGIELFGPSYKGTLIFSPYAWVDVRIPFSSTWTFVTEYYENLQYKLRPGGLVLEGTLDYLFAESADLNCSLWLKGSWRQIRGRGSEDDKFAWPDVSFVGTESSSGTGTYSCYILGGGVSFELNF